MRVKNKTPYDVQASFSPFLRSNLNTGWRLSNGRKIPIVNGQWATCLRAGKVGKRESSPGTAFSKGDAVRPGWKTVKDITKRMLNGQAVFTFRTRLLRRIWQGALHIYALLLPCLCAYAKPVFAMILRGSEASFLPQKAHEIYRLYIEIAKMREVPNLAIPDFGK